MKSRIQLTILGVVLPLVLIFLQSCHSNPVLTFPEEFEEKSFPLYGPYRVYRLPIETGVKVVNPVQISLGPGEMIFAANQSGEIYILQDRNGDGLEDEAILYADLRELGLHSPVGFTYMGDTVFIGTRSEIRAFRDSDGDLKADLSWTVFDQIPSSDHPYEWTSALNVGPDGWIYFVLTTDSWNPGASPDPHGLRGAILKVRPDGSQWERLATGIRSIHGMNFDSQGHLFFADNKGGGNAVEELNLLKVGSFYGHNPTKYEGSTGSSEPPQFALSHEVAPSGILFNPLNNDFGGTGGQLFVAFYGPGERWNRGGVSRVKITTKEHGLSFEEFPVADIPKLSDLAFGKDGSLYLAHHGVSDYWYNVVEEKTGGFYRLVYDPTLEGKNPSQRQIREESFSEASLENGKALFRIRACSACHAIEGDAELLGPNLRGIGKEYSKEELLEEIKEPSKRIKPSMIATKVTLVNGKVLLGRVIHSDEKSITLILVGNYIQKLQKDQVAKAEEDLKSLMYENLLEGLSEEEIDNLLNYLASL